MKNSISLIPIAGIPEVAGGDHLPGLIVSAMRKSRISLKDGDILVVAHKIVSKAEGRVVDLATVHPGRRARNLAKKLGKDPIKVEVILREAKELIAAEWPEGKPEGLLICRHHSDHVSCNAGVDESNVIPGTAVLLPLDPDASARRIRSALTRKFHRKIGVIVCDTFGRPWRTGLVNVALGVAGIPALIDLRGRKDDNGRVMKASVLAFADELAAAAGLVIGKTNRTPAVILRGLAWKRAPGSSRDLLRRRADDIFSERMNSERVKKIGNRKVSHG